MLYVVQVDQLRLTSMGYFIRHHHLDDMLIERSDSMPTLDFEINKEISLRQFLGQDQFR